MFHHSLYSSAPVPPVLAGLVLGIVIVSPCLDIVPVGNTSGSDAGFATGATGAGVDCAAGADAGAAGVGAGAEAGAWTGTARAVLDVSALISVSVVFGPGRPSAGVILRFF